MKLLTYAQIRTKYGLCRKTCRKWEEQGLFPKRVILGPRKSGWLEEEIAAWEMTRLLERAVSKTVSETDQG